MKTKLLWVLCVVAVLPACITYRDFPEDMVNNPPKAKTYDKLYYTIAPFAVLSAGNGQEALHDAFRRNTPFATTEAVETVPSKGVYCNVEVLYKPPTLPAFVFGYLSVSTLTILPMWSQHDGYRVKYRVYIDGAEKKLFEYDVTRKAAAWILLLPVAWVNAFTYSEGEALQATAYQFFKDSEPLFRGYKKI